MRRSVTSRSLRRSATLFVLAGIGVVVVGGVMVWSYGRILAELYVSDVEDDGTYAQVKLYRGRVCLVRTVAEGDLSARVDSDTQPFRGLMGGAGGGEGFLGFYWYEGPEYRSRAPWGEYVIMYQRLDLPLWLPLVILGALTVVAAARVIRALRAGGLVLCSTCSYDLRGNVSGRCPECGTPVVDGTSADIPSSHAGG